MKTNFTLNEEDLKRAIIHWLNSLNKIDYEIKDLKIEYENNSKPIKNIIAKTSILNEFSVKCKTCGNEFKYDGNPEGTTFWCFKCEVNVEFTQEQLSNII